ncbi:uncharacterized protein LOC129755584 [Uranotaenia lowii]|uniref:uncharacterized protein LOC129755584 n=1 Tax=Uranotaenia lowii TaxID=190385 RepID=UPI002479138F|nr:uncharacterized protein LOC129755584 [Uranotaenia lowii]
MQNQSAENKTDCEQADTTTGDAGERNVKLADTRNFRRTLDTAYQRFGSQQPDQILAIPTIDRYNPEEVRQYIDTFAKKSEECVDQKMQGCEEYMQVANWCELMHSNGLDKSCNHELALAMKTIAATERFPAPKNANGVDFRILYLNLSNMMMGHPIMEMNKATSDVLVSVYQDTLKEVQMTENVSRSSIIQNCMQRIACPKKTGPSVEDSSSTAAVFLDTNVNPLQIQLKDLFRDTS